MGEFVNWNDAKVYVLSHTLHYGNGAIGGKKAYKTVDGRCAIFQLNEHTQRLLNSSKMTTIMNVPFTVEELNKAQVELLQKNELFEGAILDLCLFRLWSYGIYHKDAPVNVSISAWEWGAI